MKILHYVTGPIQVNTYVAYDEETRKAFIVDPGGYDKRITDKIREMGLDLEYIILNYLLGTLIKNLDMKIIITVFKVGIFERRHLTLKLSNT